MGYLLVACWGSSCQKQGGGEGVCYVHLSVVRLGHLRAKLFCYWLCLLSSLSSLECFVLTWHPAGDVPVTCLRGGFSPSQGGGVVRSLLASGTFLELPPGMFLRIRSDIYTLLGDY